jgi:hypothetical protein
MTRIVSSRFATRRLRRALAATLGKGRGKSNMERPGLRRRG